MLCCQDGVLKGTKLNLYALITLIHIDLGEKFVTLVIENGCLLLILIVHKLHYLMEKSNMVMLQSVLAEVIFYENKNEVSMFMERKKTIKKEREEEKETSGCDIY